MAKVRFYDVVGKKPVMIPESDVTYVNKKTKKVESWEYISSPDKCTLGYKWIGPW